MRDREGGWDDWHGGFPPPHPYPPPPGPGFYQPPPPYGY